MNLAIYTTSSAGGAPLQWRVMMWPPPGRSRHWSGAPPAHDLLQPGVRDVDDAAVELRHALHLSLGHRIVGVLEGEEPRRVLVDDAAGLAIGLGALGFVGGRAGVLERLVEAGVGEAREVQRALAVEVGE